MQHPIDFSHERDLTVDDLVKRVEYYYPEADFDLLRKAYEFADKAHENQKRNSGEPYIIHPANVAATLIKLKMDMDSIISGLLHDVIEDCHVNSDEIQEKFSPNIANIVIGLTKISKIKFKTVMENQAENFRKMVVAMAKDVRVIIVKLADRMHNMRTLQYVSETKQMKIAQETLDIYVPLASRLGINAIKAELEDLCLRFLKSEVYFRLAEKVAMKKSERDAYIRETVEALKEKLGKYGVKAEVKGRSKNFFSIFKKMQARGVDFEQIQDILAFRIIVNNITECYKCLGIIHSSFTPIPGRFKDYIAIPKTNKYQSLHTTVLGPKVERIEIQIRTHEMDEVAESGVAAHWQYKEGLVNGEKKLSWISDLVEFNQSVSNNMEFMDAVKNDLNIGGVFVFTPKGDVIELKYGATPLDFAYAIHTEVGNHCVGAKVDGKMVPLRHRLKSGDSLEIITSKTQTPSKDWLNIVKTSRAKTKIKQWLLKADRERHQVLGEEMLEETFKLLSSSVKSLIKSGDMDRVVREFNLKNVEELYVWVGSGKLSAKNVVAKIPSLQEKSQEKVDKELDDHYGHLTMRARKVADKENAVVVDGAYDVLVRLAKCCNPIPGDPIIGVITRGRGVAVHTTTCPRKDDIEVGRLIDVDWNPNIHFTHPVNIRIITHDHPGILAKISKSINNLGINIRSAMAKSLPDRRGSFIYEIEVKDYNELFKVINTIEGMEDVINVYRV